MVLDIIWPIWPRTPSLGLFFFFPVCVVSSNIVLNYFCYLLIFDMVLFLFFVSFFVILSGAVFDLLMQLLSCCPCCQAFVVSVDDKRLGKCFFRMLICWLMYCLLQCWGSHFLVTIVLCCLVPKRRRPTGVHC